jgi:integrase
MDLKTGPRSVYVIDCWGAIRCWLMLHPRGNDRNAPLFCSFANPARTIHSTEAQKMVKRVSKRAGVRIGQNGESEVHPHIFRHTRATRAAENGWMEAELRAYFGWSARSPMPAHYVHLAKRHMTQKIKDEANLDPILKRVQTDPRAALAEASAAGGVAAAREMLDALGLLPKMPKKVDP